MTHFYWSNWDYPLLAGGYRRRLPNLYFLPFYNPLQLRHVVLSTPYIEGLRLLLHFMSVNSKLIGYETVFDHFVTCGQTSTSGVYQTTTSRDLTVSNVEATSYSIDLAPAQNTVINLVSLSTQASVLHLCAVLRLARCTVLLLSFVLSLGRCIVLCLVQCIHPVRCVSHSTLCSTKYSAMSFIAVSTRCR